jgi:dihydroneopterin aldolase
MEKNKIKKNIIFSLILITSLAYSASPFKVGETLNYQAYFSRIKAAKGILKVLNIEKINDIEHIMFSLKLKQRVLQIDYSLSMMLLIYGLVKRV